jgi:hypothetical protein
MARILTPARYVKRIFRLYDASYTASRHHTNKPAENRKIASVRGENRLNTRLAESRCQQGVENAFAAQTLLTHPAEEGAH